MDLGGDYSDLRNISMRSLRQGVGVRRPISQARSVLASTFNSLAHCFLVFFNSMRRLLITRPRGTGSFGDKMATNGPFSCKDYARGSIDVLGRGNQLGGVAPWWHGASIGRRWG